MTTVIEIAIALVVSLLAISAATSLLLGDPAGHAPHAGAGLPDSRVSAEWHASGMGAGPVAHQAQG